MQKARSPKGAVAVNSGADGKKLHAEAEQAPAAAEEGLGEERPSLPEAEAEAGARLLLLLAGTPLLLFLAAVRMCTRAAAPAPMASEEEEEPEGEDPLPAEKEGQERPSPGSARRGAVARLPSPSRCVVAAAAARRSPQSSPGREGTAQDRAAAPEREEPALSPLVPRGQLFQSSPPAEPNPEAEPAAEEDPEPPRDAVPQDEEFTRRAEQLLQQSWVRSSGAAPIFEEEEDERRYLARRSEALSCFVEAFCEQRASNDVLRKAGEWLINETERLQEETRQNAGELEYYRTLAEDFESRAEAAVEAGAAEAVAEEAAEEASPPPARRLARTP